MEEAKRLKISSKEERERRWAAMPKNTRAIRVTKEIIDELLRKQRWSTEDIAIGLGMPQREVETLKALTKKEVYDNPHQFKGFKR